MRRALVSAVLLLLVMIGAPSCGRSPIHITTDIAKTVQVRGATDLHHLAWSPDSTRISVSARYDPYTRRIAVVSLSGEVDLITDGHDDAFPVWSPEGDNIAFVRGFEQKHAHAPPSRTVLHMIAADGKGLVQLTHGQAPTPLILPAWSPDGTHIAAITFAGVFLTSARPVPSESGEMITLATVGTALALAWSPSGRSIAVLSFEPMVFDFGMAYGGELRCIDTSSGTHRRVAFFTRGLLLGGGLKWSADERTVILGGLSDDHEKESQLCFRQVGVGNGAVRRMATLENLAEYDFSSSSFSWHPNGDLVAVTASQKTGDNAGQIHEGLFVFNAANGRLLSKPLSARHLAYAEWSPDGQWIACVRGSNEIVFVRVQRH